MTIEREALERGQIDFSDLVDPAAPLLDPVHPGAVLAEDWLEPLGLGVEALAEALKVPAALLGEVMAGRRALSAEIALRLARYFGSSPDFWLGLQARYDLEQALRASGGRILAEVTPRAA